MSRRETVYLVPAFDLGGRDLDVVILGMPDEVRSAALAALERVLHCAPRWMRSLTLRWDESDNEHDATVSADHVYRRCLVTVCPAFLSLGPRDRERVMLHELVHVSLDALHTAALQTVHAVTEEDSDMRTMAEKIVESALESCTEDLAHLLRDLMSSPKRGRWRFEP